MIIFPASMRTGKQKCFSSEETYKSRKAFLHKQGFFKAI